MLAVLTIKIHFDQDWLTVIIIAQLIRIHHNLFPLHASLLLWLALRFVNWLEIFMRFEAV